MIFLSTTIRADFPGLAQAGIYLDNAATTHKPQLVLDAEKSFYQNFTANPYRAQHRAGRKATQLYETSRGIVADYLGADVNEVIFTRNTTEGINLLAYSWGLKNLGPDDRIVLPIYEHHSNLVPWQMVSQQTGAELCFMYPNEDGLITSEEIARVVTANTALIGCAHISNVYGTASPVEALVQAAQAVGARVFLDCAQSVAHMPLNLHELGVDAAALSGHKVYGPMGIGVLYVRRGLLEGLEPFLLGGEMIDQVYEQSASFLQGPRRFEAGTPPVPGAYGLAHALDYLYQIGWDRIAQTERELLIQLLEGLNDMEGVQIIGSPQACKRAGCLVSFTYSPLNTQDVAYDLDLGGVAIRAGAQCAQPLHRYLGLEASLRISPCLYNTADEIDRCLQLLREAPRRISRRMISSLP